MSSAQPQPVGGTRPPDRGITVATAVAFAPGPLTFTEIAEAAGLSKSAVFGLLGALQRSGLVERDADGRYHAGWLLGGLRQRDRRRPRRAPADAAFLAFLSERLTEEIIATTHRRTTSAASDAHTERCLVVLDDLLLTLARGALPDDTTLHLLTRAYADHPEFRPEWRHPLAAGTGTVFS